MPQIEYIILEKCGQTFGMEYFPSVLISEVVPQIKTGELLRKDENFRTKTIHSGNYQNEFPYSVVLPISLATAFVQPDPAIPAIADVCKDSLTASFGYVNVSEIYERLGQSVFNALPALHSFTGCDLTKRKKIERYSYDRINNPNKEALEQTLATLDNARYAVCCSSGMGAVTMMTHLLKTGDHILCSNDVYGGTYRFFMSIAEKFGFEITFHDAADVNQFASNVKKNTKLVWLESPTNPLLKVLDIEGISKATHECNRELLVTVDNTFLSPYFQKPLSFGADCVAYSLTKYVNGHSDTILGALITDNKDVHEKLRVLQGASGIIPSPFDCFLVCRSLKTLGLRMKVHMKNSYKVAKFLESHKMVETVLHPGLPTHPGYDIVKRQWSGWSGMTSFYIKGGGASESVLFVKSLKLFISAISLGGYESLAQIPALQTHANIPVEERNFYHFEAFVANNEFDSILLGETWLSSRKQFRLSNYCCYWHDREDAYVGVAILIKSCTLVQSNCVTYNNDTRTNAVCMRKNDGFLKPDKHFQTKAIHSADQHTKHPFAVVAPIVVASTFYQEDPSQIKGYDYGRNNNPNRDSLEKTLAVLDEAKFTVCCASRMGAIITVMHVLKAGDHILCSDDVDSDTYYFFDKVAINYNLEVSFQDAKDVSSFISFIQKNTKMIWLEPLSNPLLRIYDIKEIAKAAHQCSPEILVTVDNTYLSCYLHRPLNFGADIVVYSLTKYINGHSDIVSGAVLTSKREIHDVIRLDQITCGIIPSPFDCYLVFRSLRTLSLRMKCHMQNSYKVAKFLESHNMVEAVLHPGFPAHPGHDIAKKLWCGWNGMVSFYIKGGGEQESIIFVKSLKIFISNVCAGGCESSVIIPAFQTRTDDEQRKKMKIRDNLIRLSVGLEDVHDLICDLDNALNCVADHKGKGKGKGKGGNEKILVVNG